MQSMLGVLSLHSLVMQHFDVENTLDQWSATCSPRAKSGPPTHFIGPMASFRICLFIRPATSLRNYATFANDNIKNFFVQCWERSFLDICSRY